MKKYDLPYHPLWEQGYVSIGDVHTTRPLTANMTEEETRFFGLKRECGMHITEKTSKPTVGRCCGVSARRRPPAPVSL